MDMMLIPLTAELLYPGLQKLGYPSGPLSRMLGGLFAGILAVLCGGILEVQISDNPPGEPVSVGCISFTPLTVRVAVDMVDHSAILFYLSG